jgi:hypothetical protein
MDLGFVKTIRVENQGAGLMKQRIASNDLLFFGRCSTLHVLLECCNSKLPCMNSC